MNRTLLHVLAHPTLGELRLGQFLSFMSAMAWVICLLWPGDTMSRPTYMVMSHIGNDFFWAAVFGGVMVFQGVRLFLTDSRPCTYSYMVNGLISLIWVFTSVSMLVSIYPPPAAIAGEIVVTIISVWVFANHKTSATAQERESE